MLTQRTQRSALTHDFSQHGNTRAASQNMGKQSNFYNFFEKVTQIFYCKLKSNALLY